MASHLEYSHYSQDSEDLANSLDRLELVKERREVVGEDGKKVNDVHETLDELAMIRTGEEPNKEFYCKPSHINSFQNTDNIIGI